PCVFHMHALFWFFLRPPTSSTPFPYTTLFRSLLRRARRQAYHAERAAHPQDRPRSPTDRLAAAAVLERRLADQLEDLAQRLAGEDRKSTRLNSSHVKISYAVFCFKKKNGSQP